MDVTRVLHMNRGDGETSYAKNSILQSNIISLARKVIDDALKKLMVRNSEISSIGIADLGCSSGPNSLLSVSNIVDTIQNLCPGLDRPVPELRVSLNDLPNNDFNYIFTSLPEFYDRVIKIDNKESLGLNGREGGQCFVSAVPGSFYGRLFPRESLHFIHSSSSLHWLSQVPDLDNKGRIYLSKTSPKSAYKAYALQFHNDFSLFLRSRSEELVHGGRMALSFFGRNSLDPTAEEGGYHWELLAQALMSMASEGMIEEEKIDAFHIPYYAASIEELKIAIAIEGSFSIDRLEISMVDWEDGISINDKNYEMVRSESEALASGRRKAKTIRAVVEPMLEPTFGQNVMDELFERYAKIVGDYFYMGLSTYRQLVLSWKLIILTTSM
ncbi:unnamed protein product [Cochlearia groenlandica]